MTKFIFDLDGTLTKELTIPYLAKYFNLDYEIDEYMNEMIKGNKPFLESFIKCSHILNQYPDTKISEVISTLTFRSSLLNFINDHPDNCVIATVHLDCWLHKLKKLINCKFYTSETTLIDKKIIKIHKIMKKENIVKKYKEFGDKVVVIGSYIGDIEAMRYADVSIASGLTYMPSTSVLSMANYLIVKEEALCRQLNLLL